MRKRHKLKKHSCTLCKPHKMNGDCRRNSSDLSQLKEWEHEQKLLLESQYHPPRELRKRGNIHLIRHIHILYGGKSRSLSVLRLQYGREWGEKAERYYSATS